MKKNILCRLACGVFFCCSAYGMITYNPVQVWQQWWLAIDAYNPLLIPYNISIYNISIKDLQFILSSQDEKFNNTLLHQAVFMHNSAAVKELLLYGSPFTDLNKAGETPIAIALKNQLIPTMNSDDYKKIAEMLALWGSKIPLGLQSKWITDIALLRNALIDWAKGGKEDLFKIVTLNEDLNGFKYMKKITEQAESASKNYYNLEKEKNNLEAEYNKLGNVLPVTQEIVNKISSIEQEYRITINKFIKATEEHKKTELEIRRIFYVHDDTRGTLLHVAVNNGQIEVLQSLIHFYLIYGLTSEEAGWIDERDNIGDTALIKAVKLNNKDAVGILLMRGADSNIRNFGGHTAFDLAKQQNNFNLLQLFQSEQYEYTPQALGPIKKIEKSEETKYFSENIISEEFKKKVKEMEASEAFSDQEWIDALNNIKQDIYYFQLKQDDPTFFVSYIHKAVLENRMDIVKQILQIKPDLLYVHDNNKSQKYPKYPIHYAAALGQLDFVKYFLEQDSKKFGLLWAKDAFGRNALMYACGSGNNELVEYLIQEMKKGRTIQDQDLFDFKGDSILKFAIVTNVPNTLKKKRTAIVRIVCENFPKLINHNDRFSQTPIYYAIEQGWLGSVNVLLKNKAIMYMYNKPLGYSLINFAIEKALENPKEKRRITIIKKLCKKFKTWINAIPVMGFNVYSLPLYFALTFKSGKTPIKKVEEVRVQIVNILLQNGADPLAKSKIFDFANKKIVEKTPFDVQPLSKEILEKTLKKEDKTKVLKKDNTQVFIDFTKALSHIVL